MYTYTPRTVFIDDAVGVDGTRVRVGDVVSIVDEQDERTYYALVSERAAGDAHRILTVAMPNARRHEHANIRECDMVDTVSKCTRTTHIRRRALCARRARRHGLCAGSVAVCHVRRTLANGRQ